MNKGTKILIVEDDVFIRDIYNVKFNQEGFEVFLAEDGFKALEKLETVVPDIVLLDITMPGLDGIDVLKKVKENPALVNVPIIMLTNISEKERVQEAKELGIDEYMIKSQFTPSEVVQKVNSLLDA
ncbi:MAG: response regulator [bacterium]